MQHCTTLVLLLASIMHATVAQNTCTVGRITLASIPSNTYITQDGVAYTVDFCSPTAPSSSSALVPCSSAGYVQAYNLSTFECLDSYTTVTAGLTEFATPNSTGVFFTVSANSTNQLANVTVMCDPQGSSSSATLTSATMFSGVNASGGLSLTFSSYAACSVSALFCNLSTTTCASSAKSCIDGVCFDQSCVNVNRSSSSWYPSGALMVTFTVSDCSGTPLAGLGLTDFTVALNGVPVSAVQYMYEVPTVLTTAAQVVPAVTTLLLDQSASVTMSDEQAVLIDAAITYVTTVASSNNNQYFAVIAFDGSVTPVVVQQYTTDSAAVIRALNTSLPPAGLTDPDSTNLYGAVEFALDTAIAERFAFGTLNASVLDTLIVFSGGYDTANRSTAAAALAAALKYENYVSIISIGLATYSDTPFLTSLATSGIYIFPTTADLVSTFSQIAQQMTLAASGAYTMAFCVPNRAGEVSVTISMNSSDGFTTVVPVTIPLNSSLFVGGCTRSFVTALINSSASQIPSSTGLSVYQASLNSQFTTIVPSSGAFFFDVLNTGQTSLFDVNVSPANLQVFYLLGSPCEELSLLCYNASFLSYAAVSGAAPGTTVHFMILNPFGTPMTTTVSLTAVGTPSPYVLTPSPGIPPAAPTPLVVPIIYVSNASVAGGVDSAATWVFLGYGIIMLVLFAVALFLNCCFEATPRHVYDNALTSSPRYARVPLQNGLDTSAPYAGSLGFRSPPATELQHRSLGPESLMMSSPRPHIPPILDSGISPYRGVPYRTLPSGRSFHDPSAPLDVKYQQNLPHESIDEL